MDYGEYGSDAVTRLATEIGAGKIPDLIDSSFPAAAQWAASGKLEDLWPYIDRDPDLSRDGLMTRALEAEEIGGKLFSVGTGFTIMTCVGRKDIFGDRMTLTGEEMWEAMEAMPSGSGCWKSW